MAHSGQELEIKLTGAPADVAALRRSPLFREGAANGGGWERLVTTYYDSGDGRLEKAGASLRLREEAGRRIQTMKLSSSGAFGRLEEERALAEDEAFPYIPYTDEFAALLAHAGRDLEPAARTVTDRYSVVIVTGGAKIEAAFDIGRAECWRGGTPFAAAPLAEAELELLAGDPKALFKTARKCLKANDGRLRLSIASKAEQARRLADPFVAVRPEAGLTLDAAGTTGAALAASLTQCAKRMIDCAPAIVDLRAPEGVHQMRVALRRFRALERIFRKAADDARLEKLAADARKWARLLGAARDWDVFLAETLPESLPGGYAAGGLNALRTRAEALRAEAWDRVARKVAGARFSLFALGLLEAAHRIGAARSPELDENIRAFAARALDWRLDKARLVAAGIESASPAARHPLRIELKKLRYAAQTFRSLYDKGGRKAYMGAMSRMQDAFGALNDAVMAQELANEAALGQGREAARAAGFLAGWRAGEAEARASEVGEDWRAFAALEPFWRDV
ncbi:MAG: CHAD domain-containing protein [Pseudomonadota bacterium]|nr:CHAD domain-containing protein [Pseudomonadota bacterium]